MENFTLVTQVWDPVRRRYVEDELALWDALPSWQREALQRLSEAFPGSEVLDEPGTGSEAPSAA